MATASIDLPPYLTPNDVAEACSISRRRALTMLRGAGILEKIGGRWYVRESRLRERLPDIHDRAWVRLNQGLFEQPGPGSEK